MRSKRSLSTRSFSSWISRSAWKRAISASICFSSSASRARNTVASTSARREVSSNHFFASPIMASSVTRFSAYSFQFAASSIFFSVSLIRFWNSFCASSFSRADCDCDDTFASSCTAALIRASMSAETSSHLSSLHPHFTSLCFTQLESAVDEKLHRGVTSSQRRLSTGANRVSLKYAV